MPTSEEVKEAIIRGVREQNNIKNTTELIEKMNLACFEKCITSPSSSLSKTENACIPQCTEKYIAAWNLVHSTLISRLQREAANAGASGL